MSCMRQIHQVGISASASGTWKMEVRGALSPECYGISNLPQKRHGFGYRSGILSPRARAIWSP